MGILRYIVLLALYSYLMYLLGTWAWAKWQTYKEKKAKEKYNATPKGKLESALLKVNSAIQRSEAALVKKKNKIYEGTLKAEKIVGMSKAGAAKFEQGKEKLKKQIVGYEFLIDFYHKMRAKLENALQEIELLEFMSEGEEESSKEEFEKFNEIQDLIDINLRYELQSYMSELSDKNDSKETLDTLEDLIAELKFIKNQKEKMGENAHENLLEDIQLNKRAKYSLNLDAIDDLMTDFEQLKKDFLN